MKKYEKEISVLFNIEGTSSGHVYEDMGTLQSYSILIKRSSYTSFNVALWVSTPSGSQVKIFSQKDSFRI